jgi:GTPase
VASTPLRNLPLVVIAGKPNVGKSTLFNRLVGRRKAITDRTPGVTRDPVEQETEIGDRLVRLVDTGGVSGSREPLDEAVSARSVELARRADVVLLVLDVTEVTGEDESFLKQMRPLSERIILVANKADTEQRQQLSFELHRLGFPRLVAVSAESGDNVEELEGLVCALLPPAEPDAEVAEPAKPEIRVAIIGKPNTGKSTLLNRLLGEERSLVSDVPGTTRDSVEGLFEFEGHMFQAVDTAGIRRKSSVSSSVEYFSVNRAIKAVERADVALLLMDSLESVSDQDKKIAAVVVSRGHGIILCLNKWDTVKKAPNILTAMRDRVNFVFPVLHFAPILPLSAATGFGVERVLQTAVEIVRQLEVRVPSAPLNRALENWIERYPVPSGGKNLQVRFLTQSGVHPTTFVAHVNRTRAFPQSYLRYIENRIRQNFGLGMIPIRIEIEDSRS